MIRSALISLATVAAASVSMLPALAQPELASPATSVLVAQGLAKVRIADLITYKHPSGIYSLDVPKNWEVKNLSDADILRTSFTDPLENAIVVIAIAQSPDAKSSTNAMGALLQNDVEGAYGGEKDFSMDDPEVQKDGSVSVIFTYEVTVQGVKATMLGNSYVQKNGDYLTFMYVVVPDDQFDGLKEGILDIINSYDINSKAKFPL